LATLAVACGDASDEVLPDANSVAVDGRVSTGPDAMVGERAYAVGTDFSTSGILSEVDVPTHEVTTGVVAGVASTDPALRYFNGKLYIVNRYGADNITIVDPATNQLITQISTGAGTNPQDVAVKGNKLYVAALNSGNIIILDETNPSATPDTIDISSYDMDGVPDASSLYLVGNLLFVSLELLDGSFVSQGGKVVVIDTATDTVIDDVELTHNNPFGTFELRRDTSELFITTTDFAGTGCVERVQTSPPYAVDCVVDEASLGGYASTIRSHGDTLWLAVATSFTEGHVIDVTGGTPGSTPLTANTFQATDLALCPSGAIVVNDQTNGGLRLYVDGSEVTTSVLNIGLPPSLSNGIVCF